MDMGGGRKHKVVWELLFARAYPAMTEDLSWVLTKGEPPPQLEKLV